MPKLKSSGLIGNVAFPRFMARSRLFEQGKVQNPAVTTIEINCELFGETFDCYLVHIRPLAVLLESTWGEYDISSENIELLPGYRKPLRETEHAAR